MIVRHCQDISDREIDAAIDWMRAADRTGVITPGRIFQALDKAPVRGGCMALFLSTMQRNGNLEVPVTVRTPRAAPAKERDHEGRREGH